MLFINSLVIHTCYSQGFNYRNYNSKDGLPSSEVYCTAQDSSGYIWFGTDAGVCKFDGTRFTKYTTENGLADNTVLHLYVDHNGKVWFGTFSGGVSYYFQDSIYTVAANDSLKKLINFGMNYINTMCVDDKDRLWLGLSSYGGVIYLDKEDNYMDIHQFQSDSFAKQIVLVGKDSYPVYAASPMNKNPVLEVSIREGSNFFSLPLKKKEVLSNKMKIYRSPSGLLVFSLSNKAYVIKNEMLLRFYIMPSVVTTIFIDPLDHIWISAYKNGLEKYDCNYLDLPPQKYFDDLSVSDCMYDKERGLWITTLEKGVYYIPSTLIYQLKVENIPNTNFTSVTSSGNKIFVGDGGGYVYQYHFDSTTHTFGFDKLFKKSSYYIFKLFSNDNNKLIISSNYFTISNLKTNESRSLKFKEHSVIVKDIYKAHDGTIQLAGLGAYVELDSNDNFIRALKVPMRTNAVIKTHDNHVYIGTANGVWELQKDYFQYLGTTNPLLKYRTDDILEDSYHNVWFVTREVGVLFKKAERYYLINKKSGLISNQCSGIVQDKEGNIWVSTYEGLSKIELYNGVPYHIENYTIYNGLHSNEIKSLYLYNEYLLLVNNEGIDYFKYNDDLKNHAPPPIYIESLMIDGQPVPILDSVISLDYKSRMIEFYFSSLTYTSFGKKKYKYKLDGYDKEWNYTNNNNIRYTNLPAGRYLFLIYGVNNNGITSKDPARISFVVTLPWWKTPFFFTVVFISSILLFFIISLVYVRSIKNKAKKTARIDYLLAESRLIALRAQMNPHFIFNVINSIQYYVLQNDKDKAYDYLARFSRLIRLVLDSSKYLKIPLEREIEILKYYTELEKLRFGEELKIEMSIHTNTDAELIMIPNMIIQPYVENAIIHGLLPKKKNALLRISIEERPGFLYAEVLDNGIGRLKSAELSKTSSHSSSGMIITSERLKVIQTTSDVDVQVKIIDLFDDHSNPTGTKVEISIPIKKEV